MKSEHELSTKSLKDLEFDLETSINPIIIFCYSNKAKTPQTIKRKSKNKCKSLVGKTKNQTLSSTPTHL
jgi:hypothetical protein